MAFRLAWKNETASTSLVVASVPVAHDVLIAYAVTDNTTLATFTWPSGFVSLGSQLTTLDGQTLSAAIKNDATGAEGSLTIGSSLACIGGIIAMSGRDNTNPQDFVVGITNNNTGQGTPWSLASASKTPGNDGCDLACIIGHDTTNNSKPVSSFATTTGTTGAWTTRQEVNEGGAANFKNMGIGTATQVTAGAFVVTATGTDAGQTAARAVFIIGLKAAGGAASFNPGWATGATKTIGAAF